MRTAREGGKNKQHQTHTKTLETKTIRVKSWRDTLSLLPHTPATIAFAAGFFVLFALPGITSSLRSETDMPANDEQQLLMSSAPTETTVSELAETSNNSAGLGDGNENGPSSASSSVNLNVSISSNSSSSEDSTTKQESTVTVNGLPVEPGRGGRINEVVEDQNSRTRIRGRISTDGNSSISISTDYDVKSEGD